MRINDRRIQLAYRSIWAVVGVVSTVLTFTDHMGKNGDGISPMLFFTSWSVWLATVVALIVFGDTLYHVIKKEMEGYLTSLPILKFAADIMIIATFVVAGFVLPDKLWSAGYWTIGGAFKHFLLPILTVMDAVLFDPRNQYRVSYPFLGVVLPLLYWIVVVTRCLVYRSSCGGMIPEAEWKYYYPYGFTNFDNGHSVKGLILMLAGILVGLILIGFIFWTIDKCHKEEGKLKFDAHVDTDNMKDIFARIHR